MDAKIGASLYSDGIIANGVRLVMRKWMKERDEIGAIFADSTTVFAHVSVLAESRDTEQCRNHLKLKNDVDMAIICTVTAVHTNARKSGTVTVWICSDAQDTSLKVTIYGELSSELDDVCQGSVIAVLNPDLSGHSADNNYRCISINQCDNVLLVGEVDGLQTCKGVTAVGAGCKNVVYRHHQGEYCKFHLKNTKSVRTGKPSRKRSDAGKVEDMVKCIQDRIEKREDDVEVTNPMVFKPAEPTNPAKLISKIGGLNSLMQRVTHKHAAMRQLEPARKPVTTVGTVAVRPTTNREAPAGKKNREFESLVSKLKSQVSSVSCPITVRCIALQHKDSNKIPRLLHHITKYVNDVDSEVAERSNILKICGYLLDHPDESIAIESLKLRRLLKKFVRSSVKSNETSAALVERKRQEPSHSSHERSVVRRRASLIVS
ncbi:Mcm10 replication factor [Babesia caballi]|uniref:Mcm10 replication factor n=1 Tax=Babesia caballi TaxID=5871 RepID=A0AAV4LXB0_BABCB|nr:Mcm10 replication factor [Babesia caballi]